MKKNFMNIRVQLTSRQMTLENLAIEMKKLGIKKVSTSSLSNKLNGRRKFMPDEMEAISRILDCDIVYLFFELKYTKCVLNNN